MNFSTRLLEFSKTLLLLCATVAAFSVSAVTIPSQPLSVQASSKPMIMLAVGRDHRMFYEAYNDASDIDGDGTLDIRFKPYITYLGLFDSNVCYTHNNANDNTGLYTPSSAAISASMTVGTKTYTVKQCPGSWSGNWLNYITTSRLDALRVVLYGGTREVDTATQTILRRGYIPQDAHSWAKEYTSLAVDGFLISDYTPLAQPNANRRHFFGTLTPNASTNCDPLANCSSIAPWLSIVTNSNRRVWEWASTERPVLNGSAGGTRNNYTVRVSVCTASFNAGCKLYPSGGYKPFGLLHDFGENEAALFGMFSGSYDNHLSGGKLRKVMSSFKAEIDQTDGSFIPNLGGIIQNFDAFRIYGFNRGGTSQAYQGGVVGNRTVNQGEFPDWGNPVAELMYEATRYFANKGSATSAYTSAGTTIDDNMGLSKPAWDRPYAGQGTSTANAPYCARATLLTISDTNISFDSDQLPGVNSNFGTGLTTDLSGRHIHTGNSSNLNVSVVADFISSNDSSSIIGSRFIGQSGATFDSAPTAKSVASLSSIRGLAPEEPTKRGSYYAASVAHYAKVNDLNSGLQGDQTVDNFFVALASPLPRIDAKLPNGKVISLVPFAKSVGGAFGITAPKTAYQPTNQIVDFYVERIANSGAGDIDTTVNGGRYEAVFRINYEDVEQGNDHDMDAIVIYTVRAKADNTLDVILQPTYQAGGVKHRMGYVISGTTNDGIYLVVQDETDNQSYFLNVPPGRTPGYCDQATPPADCVRIPYLGGSTTVTATVSLANATSSISQFNFSASSSPAATFLKDPMWYAAKWGGFTEVNDNGRPDVNVEWDADGDGQPDTYFFVQNPTKLKDSLTKAFRSITERQGSSSNLASNSSGRLQTNSALYRASYVAGKWIGGLESYPISVAGGLSTTPLWRAQDNLPLWSQRKIFLHSSVGAASMTYGTLQNLASTPFASLASADQLSFVNADTFNYFRGDQSKETNNGGTLRRRESILGDMINSSPVFDPSSQLIYIGANDGMLHAFNSADGKEVFSFVPKQVVPRLKNLSSLAYSTSHEYFVDGEVTRGLRFPQTNLTTYMYAALGRGGKGIFSIKPNASNSNGTITVAPELLWEYTPIAGAQATPTSVVAAAATDADLGFMLNRPVFGLLNNGKAAIFVGNGYNSTDGKAVLYVFIINPDGTLDRVRKLDTGIGGDNGLAGPSFFDAGSNFTADVVYAGDLKGNLWKFDIADTNPDNWTVSFSGQPLFKATDSAGNPQPITAAVISEFNSYGTDANKGKNFVLFGTGSYFKLGDNTDMSVQSSYGIIDDVVAPTSIPSTTPTRTSLRERTIDINTTFNDRTIRYFSQEGTNDMAGKRGWYMDFNNPINGERVVSRAVILPTKAPIMQYTSIYPINDNVCTPSGDSYLNMVNHFTGVLPLANDVKFKDFDPSVGSNTATRSVNSVSLGIGISTSPLNFGSSGRAYNDVSNGCDAACISRGNDRGEGDAPGKTDKAELMNGNSNDKTDRVRECLSDQTTCNSGDSGLSCSKITGSCDENNRIRGRLSWREIIKD